MELGINFRGHNSTHNRCLALTIKGTSKKEENNTILISGVISQIWSSPFISHFVIARREGDQNHSYIHVFLKCVSFEYLVFTVTGAMKIHFIKKLLYQLHSLKYRTSSCLGLCNVVSQNSQSLKTEKFVNYQYFFNGNLFSIIF